MNNKKISLIIFVLGIIAYTVGLYGEEFIKIDTRYALFVIDMRKYGIDIFPTLLGNLYTDYFSPGIILMYLTSAFGLYVNKLTIALPGSILASLTLVLTYIIGSN